MTSKTVSSEADLKKIQGRLSPASILWVTILGIALAEVIAMIVVYFFQDLPYSQQTLIDAGIMTVIIFPLLYYLSFRPILQHIEKRYQAEEELRKANDELERRVQDRTEQLRITNSELEDEINVRRLAEEALQESGQRLKRAQEIAHLGSWELDLTNNKLTWSDEVYRIFGLKPQEFGATYEAFLEAVHPDDRAAVDEAYFGSIRDGRDIYEIEHRVVRRPDSEIRIVHEKCEHFRNEAGEIVRSIGMVHDITERKRAEAELERSNQKLNEILASIQDDFYVLDGDWNFVYANPLFTVKVGKKPEDFIGKNIWQMFPMHVGTILEENFRAAMEKRDVRRFELNEKYTDAWYRMTVFPSAEGITVLGADITERKKIEDALHLSEENFTKAFMLSPTALIITHLDDGHYVELNDAYCTLIGYDRAELKGHRTTDFDIFIQPSDRKAIVDRLLVDGSIHDYETSIRHRSGAVRHVVASQELITFTGETCILTTLQDITNIKMAEQALRAAHDELEQRVQERTVALAATNLELSNQISERMEVERQLRIQTTAMEAAADGILITDPDGSILWSNPALSALTGYTPGELAGQPTRLFNSGQQDTEYYRQMWATIAAGEMWQGEIVNRRKDGSLYIEHQTIAPVIGEAGKISHFIAIKHDITEQKQAAEARRKSDEKFRILADWTYDWELWIDPHEKIVYTSPSSERITGYRPEELMADPDLLLAIVHSDDRAAFADHHYRGHDKDIGAKSLQFRAIRRDGQVCWIEHVCRPLFDAENRYLGRRITNRDITERKKIEAEIQERNQREKQLIQMLHTMQLDIARDLHDTIGQNIGYLRMKLDYLNEKSPPYHEHHLKAELNQMSQVADESYDLVRGTLAILQVKVPNDLIQLFKKYADQIVERSELKVTFNNTGDAGELSAHQMRQLFYIFREALSNIEKHSGASQADVEVRWNIDTLTISIQDNGSGFDPLTTPTYGGHYGLKFMRERTEMMNGSLQITAEPGAGTHVLISVPVRSSQMVA